MTITLEEIIRSRYLLQAAPADSWREYDEDNPIPGYFEFDWLSGRHPDLYHAYALSSVGLVEKLHELIDLAGCDVLDVGAGTGRSAAVAAQKAKRVYAIDWYQSVVLFGNRWLRQDQVRNVRYINGDRGRLPFPANRFDAVMHAWAEVDAQEAYRVLKPGGYLIQLGPVPQALCGELTAELAAEYPWLGERFAPPEVFGPDYPDARLTADPSTWDGVPVQGAIDIHQFTYIAEYQNYTELAAMVGRLYGPTAKQYFLARKQSTFAWRLQIVAGQVRK